ncbi:MAG: DUF6049 family protein [Actinobacteria bacterium]|nr:DUF6049 family protein [Actinomycetota bacterium]MCL5445931.1 DUF6049 family protein [Actinomycetota bacterium]
MKINANNRYTGSDKSHCKSLTRAITELWQAWQNLSFPFVSLGSLAVALGFVALLLPQAGSGTGIHEGAARSMVHAGNPTRAGTLTSTTIHPRLNLVYQTPWANLTHPYNLRFDLTDNLASGAARSTPAATPPLKLPHNLLAGYSVTVLLYNRLTSQSAFQASLGNVSSGSILTQSTPMPLSNVAQYTEGNFGLTIDISDGYTSTSSPSSFTAGLSCMPGSGTCHGVYPLQLALQATRPDGSVSTVSSLDTYMIYVHTKPPAQKLRVSWIAPLMLPAQAVGAGGAPIPVSRNSLNTFTATLNAIKNNPATPVTLFPEPAALHQIITMASNGNSTARTALNDLTIIDSEPNDELISGPYVPINVSQLASANLTQQISDQVKQGETTMANAHLHSHGHLWLPSMSLSDQGASALRVLGITNLAVHMSNLNTQYTNLTPTNPFILNLSAHHSVTGYPLDSSSNSILSQVPIIGSTLAAYNLLANFAIVYFEAPFQPTPRGIIVFHSQNQPIPAAFVNTFLGLLNSNPVIQPVTFSQYLRSVPLLPNAADRSLILSTAQAHLMSMPPKLYSAITQSNSRLMAFESSFTSNTVSQSLYDMFLSCFNSTFSTHSALSAINGFNQAISRYLHNVSIISDKTVTFTSSKATIPITLTSKLKYPVKVLLELQGSGIQPISGRYKKVTLKHSTTVVYIPLIIRATGYFRITVRLVSVKGNMTLAAARLPVRSTAISSVAVVLSIGAILILLGWWLHTLKLKNSTERRVPKHVQRT